MTERRKKRKVKTNRWDDQAVQRRIFPSHPILLTTRGNCDTSYVIKVFQNTWRKIQMSGRRSILRQVRKNGALYVKVETLRPDYYGLCTHGGHEIRFSRILVNFYPERRLMFTIAHELGHVVDEGELHDSAVQ